MLPQQWVRFPLASTTQFLLLSSRRARSSSSTQNKYGWRSQHLGFHHLNYSGLSTISFCSKNIRKNIQHEHEHYHKRGVRLRSFAFFSSLRYSSIFLHRKYRVRNHNQRFGVQSRFNSFSSTPKRSPYAVLELNQSNKNNGIVTKGDIRAAFRRLAKAYHPDLNRHSETARVEVLTKEECEAKMAELVEAYHILLDDDDDFAARFQVGHSNKVALACELYSLDELELDRFHDVYALEMDFGSGEGEDKSRDNQDEEQDQNGADEKGENHNFSADKEGSSSSSITTKSLVQTSSCKKRILVHAHPEDSVSDLKRQLEEDHGVEWGLRQPRHPNSRSADDSLERRKDRDGLSIGWELLVLRESSDDDSILDNIGTSCQDEERGSSSIHARNNGGGSATESTGVQNQVLSYHLFLDDYRIQHGETIFVVVRKHDA